MDRNGPKEKNSKDRSKFIETEHNFDSSQKLIYKRIGHENILNFQEKKDSDLEGCCENLQKFWVALHSCPSKATLAICGAGLATVSVWCCGKQLLEGDQELPGVLPAKVSQRFQTGGEAKKKERLASIIKTRHSEFRTFYLDIG